MAGVQKICPCLWFDDEAEEAAAFYMGIFPDSRIIAVSRYPDAGGEVHGKAAGSVMLVTFELAGQSFTALNGGPQFRFNESISFQVACATQDEVDYYWDKLGAGGDEKARQCGWLKDKYGVSWQIVPSILGEMISSGDTERAKRVMSALLQMKKLVIADLERAYSG
jgi:predicted 3-demethylubiquinone-9 3-methyltransferase (glyoxalase superfamily)